MTAEDDKALSWDGDDVTTAARSTKKPKPSSEDKATAVGERLGAEAPGSALLIVYGVLGGAYLIYTVGWLVRILGDDRVAFEPLTEVMYQVGEYLAIASPALWFVTAVVLARKRRPIVRLLALILGLLVVIPWPFALLGVPR